MVVALSLRLPDNIITLVLSIQILRDYLVFLVPSKAIAHSKANIGIF